MYKYTQTEFVAMMDELMDKFKKGCQKSDAELEAAYKILNPAPVGGFIDSLVKMDKYYGTDLWEIKRKQIKCFISKCDRYEMDDIVAYCRAKFFKNEINRIIYDKSIAEECDVCMRLRLFSWTWRMLCRTEDWNPAEKHDIRRYQHPPASEDAIGYTHTSPYPCSVTLQLKPEPAFASS